MTSASIFPMGEQRENLTVHAVATEEPVPEATMGDLLVQMRRIADALEAKVDRCGEKRGETVFCGLLPGHVGYHHTLDGRDMWLDDE